ncbi:hypothetical protein HZI73_04660 [Vallitalea pronyensis]|uniref:Uncharacterized protein n=1 Tax=Vallitalea pronyensis TaxID=1348613 RepID=A0A8J8SFS0_9FIRM|nr:hypothetical protein [Vallitalea pronyensis]QUI21627.1 hypothetical protein HZI73_04660 [Vallitalea pronyensis]
MDKQSIYQLLRAYKLLGGELCKHAILHTADKIKSSELLNGGISNTPYIGTPKETLMVLLIKSSRGALHVDDELQESLGQYVTCYC